MPRAPRPGASLDHEAAQHHQEQEHGGRGVGELLLPVPLTLMRHPIASAHPTSTINPVKS